MTYEQIYKAYKHGESLKHTGCSTKKIFNAFKKYAGYQVYIVKDIDDQDVIYNYIPETDEFERIF